MSRSDRNVFRTAIIAAALAVLFGSAFRLGAQNTAEVTTKDSISRRRIQPLPALGSAPETGFQYGATVLAVWEPAAQLQTRPSSILASALRTAESQTRIRIEGERWSRGNDRRIAGSVQWQKFPLPYFGIGDQTAKSAEETFTPSGTEGIATLQQRISGTWYATGSARHLNQRITVDSSGVLRNKQVLGSTGGTLTEWSAGVLTDTRDNLFAPRTGRWIQLSYARSIDGVLSDYSYGTARLDARAYQSIATEHVLAAHVQVTNVDGAAPFDQLALVGNSDILRGYARGRYRDRFLAAAQTEYRSPIRYRLGAVAFAGAGIAAPGLNALSGRKLLPTYGVGARIQIDQQQRTGVRVDYGRGRDGASGLYIGFNQAF
jgi:Omp85 superfamily domain